MAPMRDLIINVMYGVYNIQTVSLFSSLNMSDQVSHPYKTAGKIIIPYLSIFIVLNIKLENKRFCTEL